MRRVAALAGIPLILCHSAFALSGAELLAADKGFATGFIFGASSYRLEIQAMDPERQNELVKCLADAGIGSNAMYDAVTNYIRNNPDTLAIPATVGVLRTMNAICPQAVPAD